MTRSLQGARAVLRVAFVAALLIVTATTHWPNLAMGSPEDPAPDKIIHALAFGFLTMGAWLTGWFRSRWLLWFAALGWTAVDEWSQSLPGLGRDSNPSDWIADAVGATVAMAWIAALAPVGGPAARWHQRRRREALLGLLVTPMGWINAACAAAVGAVAGVPVMVLLDGRFPRPQPFQAAVVGGVVGAVATLVFVLEVGIRGAIRRGIARGRPNVAVIRPEALGRLCVLPSAAALGGIVGLVLLSILVLLLRPTSLGAAWIDESYRRMEPTLRSCLDFAAILLAAAWATGWIRIRVAGRIDQGHLRCLTCEQLLTGQTTAPLRDPGDPLAEAPSPAEAPGAGASTVPPDPGWARAPLLQGRCPECGLAFLAPLESPRSA